MEMGTAIGMAVGISTLVTFGGTKLWDAYSMQRKYRTIIDAGLCMEKRNKAESEIKEQLHSLKNRMMLGNLIMARLCKELKIPDSEIAAYEKALGVKVNAEKK